MKHYSDISHGVFWMVVMTLLGACNFVIIRFLTESHMHPFQIVFFSNVFATALFLPYLMKKKIVLQTAHYKAYVLRAVLECVGWSLSFYAISLIPLPIHTALSYMTPLFLYTAAVVILREHSSIHRKIAFVAGLIGVLTVIHPGIDDSSLAGNNRGHVYLATILIAIACSCFATCGILIKRLTANQNPSTITFYMVFLTGLLALPLATYVWLEPTLYQWKLCLLMGVFVFGQQYAVTKAFSKAPITVVLPISFSTLIYTSVFAYFFFDEIVDVWTIAGGIIILSSVLYALYHAKSAEVGQYE